MQTVTSSTIEPRPRSRPHYRTRRLDRVPRDIRLRDGSELRLQKLEIDDRERLKTFFERCSAQAIYYRFLSPFNSLPDSLLDHLTDVDGSRHAVLILTQGAGGDEWIVAEGRYVALEKSPSVADVAFLVVDKMQRRGIATLLIHELIEIGSRNGISHFTADVLADNRAMLSLLRKVGNGRPGTVNNGVIHFEIPISCNDALVLSSSEVRAAS